MADKLSILIVDDRPENLLALEAILESPEVEIVKANSGQEALGLVLDRDYALVLLDVQMPDMDGFETAELMHGNKRTKHIPIIFVTAINKEEKHIFKGYDSGAVDYLFKPLEPDVLTSKVNVFLELHRQRVQLEEKTRELDRKVRELEELKQQLEQSNEKLRRLSSLDGLTGIPNRRRFDEYLDLEWKRAIREKKPLALIVLDLDHFKPYNDHYGHLTGDFCLKRVARALVSVIKRPADLVARYGGEEFAAILPDTSEEGARHLAEEMRLTVERMNIPHASSPVTRRVTISLGVCSLMPDGESSPNLIIEGADKALYEAKQTGRNRVVVSDRNGESPEESRGEPDLP